MTNKIGEAKCKVDKYTDLFIFLKANVSKDSNLIWEIKREKFNLFKRQKQTRRTEGVGEKKGGRRK